jgi:signal transduction histidine kinase
MDAVVVLLALASALDVALRHDPRAPRSPLWFTVPVAALAVLSLLGRRRYPLAAPLAVWLGVAAVSFVDGRLVVFAAGVAVAGFAASFLLGRVPDVVHARAGLAVVVICSAVVVRNDPSHAPADVAFVPASFALAWVAGYASRLVAERASEAEERAGRAEREREAAARLAVAEERARIAREMHDVVAHAISVIVLQVGAVRHTLPAELVGEQEALRAAEKAGRRALGEMRGLLGAMRDAGEELERAPQPGLDALGPLLDEVRGTGLAVDVRVEGEPVAVPPGLDLSAYRVVQEGLTNVIKHAAASHALVVVRYCPGGLEVEVRDDGHGPVLGDGLGHGLVGLRERVKIYGGSIDAGAAEGAGFVLRTRFPLPVEAR